MTRAHRLVVVVPVLHTSLDLGLDTCIHGLPSLDARRKGIVDGGGHDATRGEEARSGQEAGQATFPRKKCRGQRTREGRSGGEGLPKAESPKTERKRCAPVARMTRRLKIVLRRSRPRVIRLPRREDRGSQGAGIVYNCTYTDGSLV